MRKLGYAVLMLVAATQAHAACPLLSSPTPLSLSLDWRPQGGHAVIWTWQDLARWRQALVQWDQPAQARDLPGTVCVQMEVQAAAAAPAPEYVKQTEFDNTPYRFNMVQNGKRMTADDFDAWLQANGYSVGRRVDAEAPPSQETDKPTP